MTRPGNKRLRVAQNTHHGAGVNKDGRLPSIGRPINIMKVTNNCNLCPFNFIFRKIMFQGAEFWDNGFRLKSVRYLHVNFEKMPAFSSVMKQSVLNSSFQSLFQFLLLPVPLIHQSCEQSLPIPAWVDLGRHQSCSLLNANFL